MELRMWLPATSAPQKWLVGHISRLIGPGELAERNAPQNHAPFAKQMWQWKIHHV